VCEVRIHEADDAPAGVGEKLLTDLFVNTIEEVDDQRDRQPRVLDGQRLRRRKLLGHFGQKRLQRLHLVLATEGIRRGDYGLVRHLDEDL
jgi:hypothetical protein